MILIWQIAWAMFKTFPEFSKLTAADKAEYLACIRDFPPVGDLCFSGLMTWWNPLDSMAISQLNGNFIVPYWIPGAEDQSGLSLVGTQRIDETICTIFDHMREKGERPRLINVPEFVLEHISYPSMFTFREQRRYHEYVLDVGHFYPLENMSAYRRRKVKSALKRIGDEYIEVKSLDLGRESNRQLLFDAGTQWQSKNINNYGALERESMRLAIYNATDFDIQNVCLFVHGALRGFCLYQVPQDKRYVVVNAIKAIGYRQINYELIGHVFGKWFIDRGIQFANVNADYGLLPLRMFMLTLGPSHFFHKYIIEPAS